MGSLLFSTDCRHRAASIVGERIVAMPGPLEGIRILDLSAMISGPLATMMLGDQGADVIKLEAVGIGDVMRYLGTQRGGVTALYAMSNRSKRCIAVNLKDSEGIAIALDLASASDVVVQNFRPGAVDRLGVGYEAVRARNPEVIYVSVAGFGPSGPYSHKPVYDNVIQAYSGAAGIQVGPQGEPTLLRNLMCDKVTAYQTAQAITAALFARTRDIGGQHIEISMLDAASAFVWTDAAMDIAVLAEDSVRAPTIGSVYRATEMADGWITGGAVTDAQFRGACIALGRPDLADDPRFATLADRSANIADLGQELGGAYRQASKAEFIAAAEANDVPVAPILSLAEVPHDPQIRHNEVFAVVDHPQLGPLRTARHAARFSATPAVAQDTTRPSPALGEHTDEILRELGRDATTISELRRRGVVS
jgi:crotonobetainyl-CoA:carnitine CoA-transferase CaiB-like acyl-CoA transferase